MGENNADDPEFAYRAKRAIGPDGKFYQEVNEFVCEQSAYLLTVTAASAMLLSFTTGQKYHLRTLTVMMPGKSALSALLTDGPTSSTTTDKLAVHIGSGSTERTIHLTGLRGVNFTSGKVYVTPSALGAQVTITGILDPGLPSV
jgi:hypothetical protein